VARRRPASERGSDGLALSAAEQAVSPFDRFSRLLSDLNLTHPMSVQRVHELMEWVRSGDYDRIVDGAYVSRGEPQSLRADASDAAAHYAERFRQMFNELGESIEDAGKQLTEWLRKTRGGDE
jgi:hypothetical protein